MLAARTRRSVSVDLKVIGIDDHIRRVSFRKHRHGSSGCMYPSSRFCNRHALYPVNAALELKAAVGALAVNLEYDLLISAKLGVVVVDNAQ